MVIRCDSCGEDREDGIPCPGCGQLGRIDFGRGEIRDDELLPGSEHFESELAPKEITGTFVGWLSKDGGKPFPPPANAN